jgi:hypothetical protein
MGNGLTLNVKGFAHLGKHLHTEEKSVSQSPLLYWLNKAGVSLIYRSVYAANKLQCNGYGFKKAKCQGLTPFSCAQTQTQVWFDYRRMIEMTGGKE